MQGVVSREDLVEYLTHQRGSKVIGFTSGVFDLLHPGHISYLSEARKLCDLLIVGVNSDRSVKANKGEDRPVCSELDRAAVVAALSSVDCVFIFDEANNNLNVELLKPNIYIKAGDYQLEKLSSASIVEAYGGRVEIVPALPGYSSSKIIARLEALAGQQGTAVPENISYQEAPGVFVDRDGTLIEHVEYLHEVEKFKLIPGALESLKILRDRGFRVIVVTNQPGIGMGYFTKEDFFRVNRELLRAATKAGVEIDRVYFCPHSRVDKCACRKPAAGMLLRAIKELKVIPEKSFMIGDTTTDIAAGQTAGCRSILVRTGLAGADKICEAAPDFVAADIAAAADWIVARSE